MRRQLEALEERLGALEAQMADPEIFSDQARYQRVAVERAEIAPAVELFRELCKLEHELAENREALRAETDPEMRQMFEEEVEALSEKIHGLEDRLKRALLPRDPLDGKNILVEIRAGAGGDEAALFAGDVLRMYLKYAEARRWKTEILSSHVTEIGGFKEVIFSVKGERVYSRMKYESGVHRVQRVPETEAGGRIHTSTITVAVLPEAEEVDVSIDPNDLKVDVMRSSGPGGQSVNTTDSAVRLTHLPTGLVVTCQDEKSQHKNKARALTVLRSRLLEAEMRRQQDARASSRRSQVGTGDRSERIRTYNFPQGRLSDHRINLTLYSLREIIQGDLDEVLDSLAEADERARLEALADDEG